MTLKQAIQRAKRIETTIHVGEGYGYNIRVSKKDALGACESYLKDKPVFPVDDYFWENERGSIIAQAYDISEDGQKVDFLSIGR